MPIRCFLAFPINNELKAELKSVLDKLQGSGADVKWTSFENLHLTLKFIESFNENDLQKLKDTLKAQLKFEPIVSHLDSIGVFPNFDHPKIIWASLQDPNHQFAKVTEVLENTLGHFSIPKETRPFKAHITLGRVRSGKNLKNLTKTIAEIKLKSVQQQFDKIVLYKSTLTNQGPIYEALEKFYLNQL
jgi:2'-5' RNA ligase